MVRRDKQRSKRNGNFKQRGKNNKVKPSKRFTKEKSAEPRSKKFKRNDKEEPRPKETPQTNPIVGQASFDDSESEEETAIIALRKNLGINNVDDSSESEESIIENEILEDSDDGSEIVGDEEDDLSLDKSDSEDEIVDETIVDEEEESDVEDVSQEFNQISEVDNVSDPFVKHFLQQIHPTFIESISGPTCPVETHNVSWPLLGHLAIRIPECCYKEPDSKPKAILEDNIVYSRGGTVPSIDKLKHSLESLHIKPQILKNMKKGTSEDHTPVLTPLQIELFSIINNYQDLHFTQQSPKNSEDIKFTYCLHIANHILKTRTKIVNHNLKIAEKNEVLEEYRDQGLVRPKVLVVVPFKESAFRIISLLENLLFTENKANVMNKKRFLEEYTGNEIVMPKKNPKPIDFELTFTGNTSDDFRIGISVTKKSLKLYADFYSADIIVGSPLGLRTIIGAEGEPERNYDFLASVEVLILDQTEIFMMQNWEHVLHIFDHLHLQPKESHGTDFSRVRLWSLDGHSKLYRQTLIFSSINLVEISSLFNKKCSNYEGYVRAVDQVDKGSIVKIIVQIPHRFYKFSANNVGESIDNRFDFFVNTILPEYTAPHMNQTMIFIPSYFDYVKVRNYFKKESIGFTQICEYSKSGQVARARDIFFHGDVHFLLYTERFHFYNRIKVKGIRHVIFYSPPCFPHFYSEICNLMLESNMNRKKGSSFNMSVCVLYSKYDVNHLSAIVGSKTAYKMIKSEQNVHKLITGQIG